MSKKRNLSVYSLVALGFVLGACEYVTVAILPEIAVGLDASMAAAGRLVGVFAAGYAIGTPIVTAATGRIPRLRLLQMLLVLFLLANTLSMLAPSITVLAVSRAFAAVLVGTLTAVALLFVKDVVAPEYTSRAVSMVYAGMSLATVVGNPLNKSLCSILGWRAAFAVILAAGALLLPVLSHVLPKETSVAEKAGFLRQFTVLRDRRYSLCVLMTVFCYAATYVVYTYLTPILTDVLGVSEGMVSPLLLAVGLCCMSSNLLAGWIGGHGGIKRTPLVLVLQAALFAVMPSLLSQSGAGLVSTFGMCVTMYLLSTPVQVYALALAEQEHPYALNLCASTLSVAGNIGIAAGSFASSILQEAVGYRMLGYPAAGVALLSLCCNLLLLRAIKQRPVKI